MQSKFELELMKPTLKASSREEDVFDVSARQALAERARAKTRARAPMRAFSAQTEIAGLAFLARRFFRVPLPYVDDHTASNAPDLF